MTCFRYLSNIVMLIRFVMAVLDLEEIEDDDLMTLRFLACEEAMGDLVVTILLAVRCKQV